MTHTSTVRSFVATARDRDITFLAASFSYYAFASLIPILILSVVISSLVGTSFTDQIVSQIRTISPQMAAMVSDALRQSAGRATAGVVSALALVWSAFKVFRGLANAFERVYDSAADVGLVEQLRDAVVVVALIAVAAVVMGAVAAAARFVVPWFPYPNLVTFVGAFVGLLVVFLPIYYVMPPVPVSVPHVLPGAVFAAVGWSVLHAVFVYYLANAGSYKAYGVLGGILLFVTFLYALGVLVLAGAVLNVTLERAPKRSELFPSR